MPSHLDERPFGRKQRLERLLLLLLLASAAALPFIQPTTSNSASRQLPTQVVPALNAEAATPNTAAEVASVDAFTAFDIWITTVARPGTTLTAEQTELGVALAKERRAALLELIQEDPAKVFALALDDRTAARLPSVVREHLESRISAYGELSARVTLPLDPSAAPQVRRVATLGGRSYNAHVYGRRQNQGQVANAAIQGVAVGNDLAIHENPVRAVRFEEVADLEAVIDAAANAACPVSLESVLSNGDLALAEVGGRLVYLCSHGHIAALNDEIIAQEGGSGSGGGLAQSAQSEGAKTLLFIRVDFSDLTGEPLSQSDAQTLIDTTCSDYFQENSYGVTTLTGTVTAVLRMPQTADYYRTTANGDLTLLADARAAAAGAGHTLTDFNLDIVAFKQVFAGWAGQGYVGAKGTWLNGFFDLRVTCHELGHNFGLWHANYWQTTDNSTIGSGSNNEYGDSFDVMGSSPSNAAYHFNAYEKNVLNWLPTSYVNSITASGTYRLYAHDQPALNASNKYALKLNRDGSRYYWLEFRQALTGNTWLMNGVGLRWGAWANSNGGSQLLDTTPGSANGKNDSALYIGRTFSDPSASVHITPIAKGGTTPESVDVVVNIGSFAGNAAPTLSVAASALYVGTGTEVTFTATASDPNSDTLAYYWSTSDNALGTNSATFKKTWNSLGNRTVTCVVSDMKGKTATASVQVSVTATPPDQTLTLSLVNDATEAGSTGKFKIARTGNTTAQTTVSYAVSGTATAGTDYTVLTGSVQFTANATEVEIPVSPLADTLLEGDETVIVTLSAGASYNVSGDGKATLKIVDDESVQFLSPLTATPAAPAAKQAILFSCVSNIPSANYAWDFGDGTVLNNTLSNLNYTYQAEGVYTITVTASHPVTGTSISSSVQLYVKPAPFVLPVTKLSGSVRWDRTNSDSVSVTFQVPDIKPGYNPLGQSVTANIGGVVESFTLGKTGSGKSGSSSASLRVGKVGSRSTTVTTLSVTLKGSLSDTWANRGVDFNVTAKNGRRKMPVTITVGSRTYEMEVSVTFTSTANKRGSFRK